jgi:hypothetical protein
MTREAADNHEGMKEEMMGANSKDLRYSLQILERARDARKMERKVEIPDVFDLSLAIQVEAELKKSGWRP